jgi:hypothetical protein
MKRDTIGWACSYDWEDKECIHNFGGETLWKTPTWITEEMGVNNKMDSRKVASSEVDRTGSRLYPMVGLVLAELNLRVLLP